MSITTTVTRELIEKQIRRLNEIENLRRHGLKIAARGGKNAKKRSAVAVARKLGVLLHRLWLTGEVYEPLYNSARMEAPAATANA
jgi:hypothetical protein